jgi:chromosome segregation ATPase
LEAGYEEALQQEVCRCAQIRFEEQKNYLKQDAIQSAESDLSEWKGINLGDTYYAAKESLDERMNDLQLRIQDLEQQFNNGFDKMDKDLQQIQANLESPQEAAANKAAMQNLRDEIERRMKFFLQQQHSFDTQLEELNEQMQNYGRGADIFHKIMDETNEYLKQTEQMKDENSELEREIHQYDMISERAYAYKITLQQIDPDILLWAGFPQDELGRLRLGEHEYGCSLGYWS